MAKISKKTSTEVTIIANGLTTHGFWTHTEEPTRNQVELRFVGAGGGQQTTAIAEQTFLDFADVVAALAEEVRKLRV